MTEKRFVIKVPFVRSKQQVIIDNDTQKSATVDCYDDNIDYFVECLNNLHEENKALKKKNHNRRTLLVDELRGLFTMYLAQCRSISEEAIITLIMNDVKKRVFEVFDDD